MLMDLGVASMLDDSVSMSVHSWCKSIETCMHPYGLHVVDMTSPLFLKSMQIYKKTQNQESFCKSI